MEKLSEVPDRHRGDRWKDGVFIAAAVLLIALSLGLVTSRLAGKSVEHKWTVQVEEHPELVR